VQADPHADRPFRWLPSAAWTGPLDREPALAPRRALGKAIMKPSPCVLTSKPPCRRHLATHDRVVHPQELEPGRPRAAH
jgi:hypothetical protein